MASCAMKQEGPRLVCLSIVVECLPHGLVTRAGEGVGEGRVEEAGGVPNTVALMKVVVE
jgi:hypothetical protein